MFGTLKHAKQGLLEFTFNIKHCYGVHITKQFWGASMAKSAKTLCGHNEQQHSFKP